MDFLCLLVFILLYKCLGVYSYVYTIVQLCMDPEDSFESHSLVPTLVPISY